MSRFSAVFVVSLLLAILSPVMATPLRMPITTLALRDDVPTTTVSSSASTSTPLEVEWLS
ncbi:hypothetical protein V8D89_006299 [Ganoderma adspersum]